MQTQSQRTQIILPKVLRLKIDRHRKIRGESLAQYLRKAAEERLTRQQKDKTDLKELAKQVIGSVKPEESGWAGVDAVKWQRNLRREEDEHRFQRFDEALKLPATKRHGR